MDVIATAMVGSVGYDARTACAAARAGLTRATQLSFMVLENDRSPGLATGHSVPLFGGGFEGDARLIRLLEGAFRDLLGQISVDQLTAHRLAFYLAIPASDREYQGIELIPEDQRSDYLEQRGDPPTVDEVARGRHILESALRTADVPEQIASSAYIRRVSVSGHTAVVELYEQVRADLAAARVDLAMVCAVDSLISTSTLTWLQKTFRLKSAESPTGLAPGEGAALVLVADPAMRSQMSNAVCAQIGISVIISSPTQFLAGDLPDGVGQFEVLRTLRDAVAGAAGGTWLIVDQNGEVFRAMDWGRTLVRYRATNPDDNAEPTLWYPATSFGDTGAAFGAVATCLSVRAHERGYAPSAHAMVLTNSDGPTRAGCVISAHEG